MEQTFYNGSAVVAKSCLTLVTPSTVACQAPLSMGLCFSRQEYWSGLPLLQGIFLTQESNLGLLHCRQVLYQLSYKVNTYFIIIYEKNCIFKILKGYIPKCLGGHFCV